MKHQKTSMYISFKQALFGKWNINCNNELKMRNGKLKESVFSSTKNDIINDASKKCP